MRRSAMENCLKRRDVMLTQSYDENDSNSINHNDFSDRLISPYKRMKVTSAQSNSRLADGANPGQWVSQASFAKTCDYDRFGKEAGLLKPDFDSAHIISGSQDNLLHYGSNTCNQVSLSRRYVAGRHRQTALTGGGHLDLPHRDVFLKDDNFAHSESQAHLGKPGSHGSILNTDSLGRHSNATASSSQDNLSHPPGGSSNSERRSAASKSGIYADAVQGAPVPEDAIWNPTPQLPVAQNPEKRRVLQTKGQLKMAAYMNTGLLTIHVIQGRHFNSCWKPHCDSYVKLSIVPEDDERKLRLKTNLIPDSNNPVFDEKFSLELQRNDESKRLLMSIWHKDTDTGLSEFLGCMSFGIKGILRGMKEVSGWYYLLTEEVGRKKHLLASMRSREPRKKRASSIPVINKDVHGLKPVTVSMTRGKNGFGFSVVEEFPVKVGRVDLASPAERAGLKQGDYIVKVNNQNVSRSTVVSVAKLVKKSGSTLLLHVQRPYHVVMEPAEEHPWKESDPIYDSIQEQETVSVMNCLGLRKEGVKKNSKMSLHHDSTVHYEGFKDGQLPTSTPMPSMQAENRLASMSCNDLKKQEAIHRLMSLEVDFIDFMHAGIQRYSRPLRHCILSAAQHATLFQNVEKLVTISEYHVKQMQENYPSVYSESDDDSQSSENCHFTASISLIYHSKVHMFCQAHETYALGLSEANCLLSELRHNDDFMRFVKEPALEVGQPSISAFIFRPLQHIKELYLVLQDIFLHTPTHSSDHGTLKQITSVLADSLSCISNMSNARVQSLTSLTSHIRSSSSQSSSARGSSASSSASSDSSSVMTLNRADHACKETDHDGQEMEDLPLIRSHCMHGSKDVEVKRLQDRLVFSDHINVFQLCQEDRHLIHQGEIFYLCSKEWMKVTMVLLSDLLLLMRSEKDGYLRVITDPLYLLDVRGIELQRRHITELILHVCPTSPVTGISMPVELVLRTPTIDDKVTWLRLLEQQLMALCGSSLDHVKAATACKADVVI